MRKVVSTEVTAGGRFDFFLDSAPRSFPVGQPTSVTPTVLAPSLWYSAIVS